MLNATLMGLGGSHYVMLETAIAFAKKGYEVFIDSININSPCKLRRLAEFFGLNVEEISGLGLGEPETGPSLVINTSGDVLSGTGDVIYLHYPSFLDHEIYYPGLHGFYQVLGKMYSFINTVFFPFLLHRIKMYLANSSFTAEFFKKYFNISPIVIHPPVNIDDILLSKPLDKHEREQYVLTVMRISPEKRPDMIIRLAKLIKCHNLKYKLIVVGSLSNYNKSLYKEILEYVMKDDLNDIVEIKTNIPRHELIELYRKAMLYIHLTPREHFGISIVEAMASGTPALVPIESGSWIDISKQDPNVSIPYNSLEEAVHMIKKIMDDDILWKKLSENSLKRAKELSRRAFHEKIYSALKHLLV